VYPPFPHPSRDGNVLESAIKPARKSNGATTSTDSDHPPVSDVASNSADTAFNTVQAT